MAVVYTVLFTEKAHQFVTTGNQSYPEARHLFNSAVWFIPQLVLELGNLLLAVGVVLVALSVMRVGLFNRWLGYAGVISGALFIIGIPVLTPVVQGFWLVGTAVLLAGRWPSGDPPAWESGDSRALDPDAAAARPTRHARTARTPPARIRPGSARRGPAKRSPAESSGGA